MNIRIGTLLGFISAFYLSILYVYDKALLIQGYERISLLIFLMGIVFLFTKMRSTSLKNLSAKDLQQHNKDLSQEDFVSFSVLLSAGFQAYVIAFAIKFLFIYFLFHYYDPTLIEMVKEYSTELFMEQRGTDETELIFQEKLEKFRNNDFGPSLTDFLGLALELFMGFILVAVTALFFKRDKPEY